MELLRCEHLTKTYGTPQNPVKALDDVSFSVEKGEFVSIVGPSGSGKSTLLHILGGVDKPTSGRVFLDGTDLHSLKEDQLAVFRRRQIGLVYQFFNLLPVLNVDENIVLPHLLDRRAMDWVRLDQIVEQMGLTDRRTHLPNQLSGGQQQRVSIGRALFNHPAIVLADEPTGNLDRRNSQDVMELLTQAARHYQQTILMITHNRSLTAAVDQVFQVSDGVLTDLGGTRDETLS